MDVRAAGASKRFQAVSNGLTKHDTNQTNLTTTLTAGLFYEWAIDLRVSIPGASTPANVNDDYETTITIQIVDGLSASANVLQELQRIVGKDYSGKIGTDIDLTTTIPAINSSSW